MKSRFDTRTIVEAGIMIALTALLGRIILFRAPMGGKVTAGSMIPLMLLAMLRGPAVGVVAGAAYGVINFLLGGYPPVSTIQWLLDYPLAYAGLGVAGFFWLPRVRKFVAGSATGDKKPVSTIDLVLPIVVLAVSTFIFNFMSDNMTLAQSLEYGGVLALVFTLIWNLARRISRATYFLPVAGAMGGISVRLLCHLLAGVWFFAENAPEGTSAWVYSLVYNAQYMVPEIIISGFILVYLAPTVTKFLRQRE